MEHCNPVKTPVQTNVDLSPRKVQESLLNERDHHTFRAIVGGSSYISHCTRPELNLTIAALACSLHTPTSRHFSLEKRIIQYINGTLNYDIKFNHNQKITQSSMRAAVDADWGG